MSFSVDKTILLNNVYVLSTGTSVGPMEKEGPLRDYFDKTYDDLYCNQKTFEKAERTLVKDAIGFAIKKAEINENEIDLAIGGDLLNQIISSNYVAKDLRHPFLGVYAACSTSTLSLGIASLFIESKFFDNILAFTSSHYSTAERQYRYPVEYGVQKPETTTYTVTGAGAIIVGSKPTNIKVAAVTFGRVVDLEQNDPADMGTAMAPAAYDTMKRHFSNLKIDSSYYDLIVTGDLGKIGKAIVEDLFSKDGIELNNYNDCGLIIFNPETQKVFSGGSGCGSSACVTYSYLISLLEAKQLKKVLIVATGALLSPVATSQKENIPSVAHAISLEVI